MEYEKVRAWVTRYALSDGVYMVEGDVCHGICSTMLKWRVKSGGTATAHGKGWHRTPEAALARAEEMRIAKIESLKKSIKKMEALQFIAQTAPINRDDWHARMA